MHVLSTPPAFVLSQDQTLNKMVSKQTFRPVQIIPLKQILASNFIVRSRVIDLTPISDFIIPSLFRATNSGAFRSLHCLIYKVLAPSASAAEHCYLNRLTSVCQALFSTFFEVFSAPSSVPTFPPDSLISLPNHSRFVKHYFLLFQNFFRAARSCSTAAGQLA